MFVYQDASIWLGISVNALGVPNRLGIALTEPSPRKILKTDDRVGPNDGDRGVINGESSSITVADNCFPLARLNSAGLDVVPKTCDCAVACSSAWIEYMTFGHAT